MVSNEPVDLVKAFSAHAGSHVPRGGGLGEAPIAKPQRRVLTVLTREKSQLNCPEDQRSSSRVGSRRPLAPEVLRKFWNLSKKLPPPPEGSRLM
jgi:hypothetical protein